MKNFSTMGDQVAIAIIANSHTPYRLHLHKRIAREIPQIKLWSIYTHETSNAPWHFDEATSNEIGAILFGKNESSEQQAKFRHSLREWMRAGRIIEWMIETKIRFVVVMGYNDVGRIRIIRSCARLGIPCWLFGDSNILSDKNSVLKKWLKKMIVRSVVRSCDGTLCCGSLGEQYFSSYGADSSRCIYFPYEPDYESIRSLSPETIECVERRFGLSPKRNRIVFSGRLTKVKRPDLVLDAFAAVAKHRPDWDLLMIGDGPLGEQLRASVPACIRNRVTWTGFLDDQLAISALYRASQILVLPSDVEPWGVVINEAAAADLAIISTKIVGASAELVRDGINGCMFPPGNLSQLISCLLEATKAGRVDAMRSASAMVLQDWRTRADPVNGLRQALAKARVIT